MQRISRAKCGTIPSPDSENDESRPGDGFQTLDNKGDNGGADGGDQTRVLQRDRLKFCLPDIA